MKYSFFCLLIMISFAVTFNLQAQGFCGNDSNAYALDIQGYNQQQQINDIIINDEIANNPLLIGGGIRTYCVIFHVIHLDESIGVGTNVAESELDATLDQLNYDFSNEDLTGFDPEIQFVRITPDCNQDISDGINRVNGSVVSGYENFGINISGGNASTLKALSVCDTEKFINIWVVNKINHPDNVLGYASYPQPIPFAEDGIVIDYRALGNSNYSKVISHEMGHYLDLFHTFIGDEESSTCPPDTDCTMQGDRVCDTKVHKRIPGMPCDEEEYNCPIISGDNLTPYEVSANHMNYTQNFCRTSFTQGQAIRMNAALNTFRSDLSQNCAGISYCEDVTASFNASSDFGLAQDQIEFTNTSVGAIEYTWEVEGQVFNTTDLIYTFNNPGSISVCLFASDGSCIDNYCLQVEIQYEDLVCSPPECDLLANGFFNTNNIASGSSFLFVSNTEQFFDIVCNWTNKHFGPRFCSDDIYGDRFDLVGWYFADNQQSSPNFPKASIVTQTPLNFIDGNEYRIKFKYISHSNVPNSAPTILKVGLTHDSSRSYVRPTDRILANIVLTQDSYQPGNYCPEEEIPYHEYVITFIHNLGDPKFLYFMNDVPAGDDDPVSSSRIKLAEVKVISCPELCSPVPDFTYLNHCETELIGSNAGDGDEYIWDFYCNGITLYGQNVSIELPEGECEVCLTIVCDTEIASTVCKMVISETQLEIMTANIHSITDFCEGSVNTTSVSVMNGLSPYSYLWSNNNQNQSFIINEGPIQDDNDFVGYYEVTVTDANNCTATASESFMIFSQPNVSNVYCENENICLEFTDHSTRSKIQFSLDGGVTFEPAIPDDLGFKCYPIDNGTHNIWARWGNGECEIEVGTFPGNCMPIPTECNDNINTIFIGNMNMSEVIENYNLTLPITDKVFYIESQLTVSENITFDNSKFFFAETAKIKIEADPIVRFENNCLLTSCDYIWGGVLVDRGKVEFDNSIIENAERGIDLRYSTAVITNGNIISDCKTGIYSDNGTIAIYSNSEINCTQRLEEYGSSTAIYSEGGDSYVNGGNIKIYDVSMSLYIFGSGKNYATFILENSEIFNNTQFGFSAIQANYSNIIISTSKIYNTIEFIQARNSFIDISFCPIIESDTYVVSSSNCYLHVKNNPNIKCNYRAIYAGDSRSLDISNNTIEVDNGVAAINIQNYIYASNEINEIFNNDINMKNGTIGGIYAVAAPNLGIVENNIVLENSSNLHTGIAVLAGEEQLISCNEISSLDMSTFIAGIRIAEASSCDIVDNFIDKCSDGIHFHNNSSIHSLSGNQFVSGRTALNTWSNLGPQPFHTNIWRFNGWQVDAISTFSPVENSTMPFTVNPNNQNSESTIPSGYTVWPSNVSQNWFFANDDNLNQAIDNCLVDIAGPPYGVMDALEAICNWIEDGKHAEIDCSESWVSSFELFSLIKNLDVKPIREDHECLSTFVANTDSTLLNSFYQIDSILYSGLDSLALSVIDSLYSNLYNHIDDQGYENVDSLFSDIVDYTVAQDSLQNIKSIQIDSILSQVMPDSCDVTKAFKDVYIFLNQGIGVDSLSRDSRNQEMLHNIALECPKRFGHIVYVARSYMNLVSRYNYDNLECERTQIVRRENARNAIKESITIYPNPTIGILNVEASHISKGDIEIYDVSSRKLKTISGFSQVSQLNVNEFESGVYIVKIIDKVTSKYEIRKIIVQR